MLRHERLSAVLDLLADKGSLSVEQIAKSFEISPATVRRDLDGLAGQKLLSRTRGGAVLQSVAYELPLRYRTARQHDEKQRIAVQAASMVSAGVSALITDSGANPATIRELRALGVEVETV